MTGSLIAFGLATLTAFSLGIGPRFTLLVLLAIAVIDLAVPLLVSGSELARLASEWRVLGVAGMIVGFVATLAIAMTVLAVVVLLAECRGGRCTFA